MACFQRFLKRKICAGDLRHPIAIETRSLDAARPTDTSPTITFTLIKNVSAAILTPSGTMRFDKINLELGVTHLFYIYFDPDLVNLEKNNTFIRILDTVPILANPRRYKLLAVKSVDEDQEYLEVGATERGDDTFKASEA